MERAQENLARAEEVKERIVELGSTYAKSMIETLLNVYALTNLHRASGNEEHRKAAAGWLPALENQLASLKRELSKPVKDRLSDFSVSDFEEQ